MTPVSALYWWYCSESQVTSVSTLGWWYCSVSQVTLVSTLDWRYCSESQVTPVSTLDWWYCSENQVTPVSTLDWRYSNECQVISMCSLGRQNLIMSCALAGVCVQIALFCGMTACNILNGTNFPRNICCLYLREPSSLYKETTGSSEIYT